MTSIELEKLELAALRARDRFSTNSFPERNALDALSRELRIMAIEAREFEQRQQQDEVVSQKID